jgi:hypothetical protein
LVSDTYLEFSKELEEGVDYTSQRQFWSFFKEKFPGFKNESEQTLQSYITVKEGIVDFNAIAPNTAWVDKYADAVRTVLGLNYSSVSKNQNGDNDANQTSAFLGGQMDAIISSAE